MHKTNNISLILVNLFSLSEFTDVYIAWAALLYIFVLVLI